MDKKDKTIKGLEYLAKWLHGKFEQTGEGDYELDAQTAEDAIALLKALDVTPEELERLKKCRHECKIDCLLEQYERVKAERDALLEAKMSTSKAAPGGWISVEDMVPPERDTIFSKLYGTDKWKDAMFRKMSDDVRVICVFEDGTRRVWHDHTVDGKWDCERLNKVPRRRITHWMMNPELPSEIHKE